MHETVVQVRSDGDLTRVKPSEDKEVDGVKGYTGCWIDNTWWWIRLREESGFPVGLRDNGAIYWDGGLRNLWQDGILLAISTGCLAFFSLPLSNVISLLIRSQMNKVGFWNEPDSVQTYTLSPVAYEMWPSANYLTSLSLTSLIIKWRNNSAYFSESLELNTKMYIQCFTQYRVQ